MPASDRVRARIDIKDALILVRDQRGLGTDGVNRITVRLVRDTTNATG